VLANLLNNAAKYTDGGGCISLTVQRIGNEAVVRIRDNGIGITSEMLPRVFELYAQGQPALAQPHGGLGIGLCLVKNLVEMHGGTVHALSKGPGKGSEFTVRLPVIDRTQQRPPPAEAEHEGSDFVVHSSRAPAANSGETMPTDPSYCRNQRLPDPRNE